MRCILLPVALLTCGFLLQTPAARGQSVEGVVLSAVDSSAIAQATVILVDLESQNSLIRVTGQDGRFGFGRPPGQMNLLEVSALGYLTHTDSLYVWDSDDRVELEIRLGVDAIPIEPLVVSGTPRPLWETTQPPYLWEYFQRQEFFGRLGSGRFFDAAALDLRFGPIATPTLLETLWPAEAYTRTGGMCKASIFVDGMRFKGELHEVPYSIHDLAGVELYGLRGPVPAEFWPSCRVIALWTQRPLTSPQPEENRRGAAWFVVLVGFALAILGGGR